MEYQRYPLICYSLNENGENKRKIRCFFNGHRVSFAPHVVELCFSNAVWYKVYCSYCKRAYPSALMHAFVEGLEVDVLFSRLCATADWCVDDRWVVSKSKLQPHSIISYEEAVLIFLPSDYSSHFLLEIFNAFRKENFHAISKIINPSARKYRRHLESYPF